MRIRVLGCSGGIGLGFHTSSYLIDDVVLIDAGTGVGQLTLDEMIKIDHIFISHAHLDHIACLPLLIDTTITSRKKPTTIWGSQSTIDLLKAHIFNDAIWPDFSRIPSQDKPFICYRTLSDYESITLFGNQFTAIPVIHTIPTFAYQLTSVTGKHYVICGDTHIQNEFWDILNHLEDLSGLAIEVAFSDQEQHIAAIAKHLSPTTLIAELNKLNHDIPIHIMHLKPGQNDLIMHELTQQNNNKTIQQLTNNQLIEL